MVSIHLKRVSVAGKDIKRAVRGIMELAKGGLEVISKGSCHDPKEVMGRS